MASVKRAAQIAAGAALAGAIVVARRGKRTGAADAAFFGGKNVVLTGGSRGLGFILAGLLLEAGATVTLCGRDADAIAAATRELERFAPALQTLTCDVRLQSECERLIATAYDTFGPIDVLINNAGIIEVGPFVNQSIADFEAAMATHFWGPLFTTRAVLPSMRERHAGHIANVASVGGVIGVPHLAPYSASKFAQVGLTQALGAELAADGIALTSIVPGLMLTGSPDHALFKGRFQAEYAWFTLSDANPLLSISADRAARRILRAIRRREAQAVIGPTAQAAKILNAVLPGPTNTALKIAAALLPRPGDDGAQSRTGAQSHSRWTQNPLTLLNRAAMRKANQDPANRAQSDGDPHPLM